MNQDQEHLKTLSTCHYVLGGLLCLFSLFPIIHLTVGIGMVTGAFPGKHSPGFPSFFGWFVIMMAGGMMLCGFALATCLFVAGGSLASRRRHKFCFVVAAISCAFMPLGTVLGVFTILVLGRPSVKALFGQGDGAGPVGASPAPPGPASPVPPPPPPPAT